MNSFGIVQASVGDRLKLTATHKGSPIFSATLESVNGSARHTEAQWPASTLEGAGGQETLKQFPSYDVIIFPQLGDGESITVTLTVGGKPPRTEKITTSVSAGWTIAIAGGQA